MNKILCIIGCSKSKTKVPAKAIECYSTSPQFRLCKNIAEQLKADIVILSSKYGFLNPDTMIEPYNNTWKEYPRYMRDISKEEARQINEFNKKSMEVMIEKVKLNHPDFFMYSRIVVLAPYHTSMRVLKKSGLYEGKFEFWFKGAKGCFDMKRHLNEKLKNELKKGEKMFEKAKEFVADSVLKITTESPWDICPSFILHIVSGTFDTETYDINSLNLEKKVLPMICNLEEYEKYKNSTTNNINEGRFSSYIELVDRSYRVKYQEKSQMLFLDSGVIEAVDNSLFLSEKVISDKIVRRMLSNSFSNYFAVFKELNIKSPVYVFLTLLNAKGYSRFIGENSLKILNEHPIENNEIILIGKREEGVVENYDEAVQILTEKSIIHLREAWGIKR
jgi:hypothetical protein